MKAGSEVAARATDDISNDATHPDLKAALAEGNRTSRKWAEQIDRAMQQTGPGQQGDNKILEAHHAVSRLIRQQAPDTTSRDFGIVAAGQLALHYWIASFGTMASYLSSLGMTDAADTMKTSADEGSRPTSSTRSWRRSCSPPDRSGSVRRGRSRQVMPIRSGIMPRAAGRLVPDRSRR